MRKELLQDTFCTVVVLPHVFFLVMVGRHPSPGFKLTLGVQTWHPRGLGLVNAIRES